MKAKTRRRRRSVNSPVLGGWPSSTHPLLALLSEERWKIALLVAGAAFLAFLSFDPKLDTWGDNAFFIILGRSIASGQGMRVISNPEAPSAGYAFGFPAMLAIIEWLSPGNHLAEKLLVVGWFLLAIPLLYLLARDVAAPGPALWTGILAASNPFMLLWSHQVMTEMPFLSLGLLVLVLLGRTVAKGDRPSDPRFLWSLAAILGTMTIRSVGLLVALAVSLVMIVRRRPRQLVFVLAFATAVMAWAIFAGYGPVLWSYAPRFFGPSPGSPSGGGVVQNLIARAKDNLWYQFLINLPMVILPFPRPWLTPWLLIAFRALLALPLLAVGLARMLWRSEPWAVYTGLYLLALLFWQPEYAITRAVIPVIPLLILSVVVGAMDVVAWCRCRWPKGSVWLQSGLLGLALTVNLWCNIDFVRTFREYSPPWQSYFEAASWISQHTPRESIVAARKPYLLHLASKRRSIFPPYSPSPEQFLERLRRSRATHVVVDQLGFRETPQFLVPAIRRYPEIFRPVYVTVTRPPTYVVEIRWPDTATSSQ